MGDNGIARDNLATVKILGYVDITHRNGSVEKFEYSAHQITAIGWVFNDVDGKVTVVHPASVTKIEIFKYKINL